MPITKRVIPNQAGGGGVETLPPAGDARREVLAQRTDELAEQAEALGDTVGTISPAALEPINEIISQINLFEVTEARADRRYKWVSIRQNSYFVTLAEAQGWRVVQGDDRECLKVKGVGGDTTRRIGDTILMWTTPERYEALRQHEKKVRDDRMNSVDADLRELAEKAAPYAKVVGNEVLSGPQQRSVFTRMTARQVAQRQLDAAIRQGRVPGMPAPGTR